MKQYIVIILLVLFVNMAGIAQADLLKLEKRPITVVLNREIRDSDPKSTSNTIIRICTPSRHSLIIQPLFIVDGKEMASGDSLKIEPQDIESMSVLKDKSATEIYGDKAKNGVIIIRTKKK